MNKIIINWELSLACNLNCSFCSQKTRREDNNSIPKKEKIFKIIENLPFWCHISFLWWETLIIPYIYEVFQKLEDKNITYEITTNGIFLYKFLEIFKSLANLKQINISIDGHWEYHDISRGKIGLYHELMLVLPKITKIKPTHISTVITKNADLKNLIKLYLDLNNFKIQEQKLIFLMNFSTKEINKSINKIPEIKISAPGEDTLENIEDYKKRFLKIFKTLKSLNKKTYLRIEPISIFKDSPISCKQLKNQYRINENWELSICEFINNSFWNIENTHFNKIIHNWEYINLKNKIENTFPLDICKSCCKQCIKK